MIRNTMLALSLFGLTSATAFAAPVVTHHSTKIVAKAEGAKEAAPAGDKKDAAPAGDKKVKHSKKAKGDKTEAPKADMPATK